MTHDGPERRRSRRILTMGASLAWIAIVLLVGLSVNRLYNQTATDLRIITVQTCESVNRGREATNEQARLMSKFLLIASVRLEEAAKDQSPKDHAESMKYVGTYRTLASSYQQIDLADCRYPPIRPHN